MLLLGSFVPVVTDYMCYLETILDYMRSSGEKHLSIAHMSHQCLFKGSCFFILHSSAL